MVEQRSPKPRAEGSSPSAPAKSKTVTERWPFLFWHWVKWFRLRGTRSVLRGAGLRWRPLHEVQKHRPSRQARPSPSAPAMKKALANASAFFNEINPFWDLWNALRAWNTPAACEIAAAVRDLFHFTWCEASNITICRANYFTVSEANSNISKRKRHHRAHSVGVIEQCSDLWYTVYINRWYEYKRKINLQNYLWPSPFRLLNLWKAWNKSTKPWFPIGSAVPVSISARTPGSRSR